MRKITLFPILLFYSSLLVSASASLILLHWIGQIMGFHVEFDFKNTLIFSLFSLVGMLSIYRGILHYTKHISGEIEVGSYKEFIYHSKVLFDLFVLHPIIDSSWVPAPLTRLFYRLTGANLGKGSYPSDALLRDWSWISTGEAVVFGTGSLLTAHIIRDGRLDIQPIKIGDRVTLGVHSVIYGGVEIGEQALILSGAVLTPGTKVGKGEVWGGNPARRLKKRRLVSIEDEPKDQLRQL